MEKIFAEGGDILQTPDWDIYMQVGAYLLRYFIPALSLLLVLKLGAAVLHKKGKKQVLGLLRMENGQDHPVYRWENVIGRGRLCDIVLDLSTVSRNHCVLTGEKNGVWHIADTGSKDGVYVNAQRQTNCILEDGDILSLGGLRLQWLPRQPEKCHHPVRDIWSTLATVLLLTVLQSLFCLQFWLSAMPGLQSIFGGFLGLIVLEWVLFLGMLLAKSWEFLLEGCAFFLSTLGMAVISAVRPGECMKQLTAVAIGMTAYGLLRWLLSNGRWIPRLRYAAAALGMLLLVITLLFGQVYYGAKNWLLLGGISLQPSEFTKVCFVFAGAAPMEKLLRTKNNVLFIAYTVALCGLLVLMNDFGTAMVFFCAFLVLAYLRSGSIGTLALALITLCFAGAIGLRLAPHALRRLESWGRIWEDPLGAGYQQTQALIGLASGGLFGLGPKQGGGNAVFAADSDMVFATLAQHWGLILALTAALCILLPAIYAIRNGEMAPGSFYAISGCAAAAIYLVQALLNTLGTLDILPLTGVTFPFLSNGGSSMVSVWCLLAFIHAEKEI